MVAVVTFPLPTVAAMLLEGVLREVTIPEEETTVDVVTFPPTRLVVLGAALLVSNLRSYCHLAQTSRWYRQYSRDPTKMYGYGHARANDDVHRYPLLPDGFEEVVAFVDAVDLAELEDITDKNMVKLLFVPVVDAAAKDPDDRVAEDCTAVVPVAPVEMVELEFLAIDELGTAAPIADMINEERMMKLKENLYYALPGAINYASGMKEPYMH
ncbi:hypothetical protein BJ138DRAFT_1104750 [Hygrophoropsis aurantiaca]|uniref:Uncharacterized protein n=1 Tax=Hygrophoropsis aurantiaca TaxID=72124 RepID=A0ACB8A2Q7_9AGAM|nr:hypothetical protein BJ138DRAFT_1104750 [Hygrophoropsis aurantiaca]